MPDLESAVFAEHLIGRFFYCHITIVIQPAIPIDWTEAVDGCDLVGVDYFSFAINCNRRFSRNFKNISNGTNDPISTDVLATLVTRDFGGRSIAEETFKAIYFPPVLFVVVDLVRLLLITQFLQGER